MANFQGNAAGGASGDDPRALLSPTSSRYAFSAVESTLANLSLTDVDDLPALEPETEAALESFTRELNKFNAWLGGLSVDQQRMSMSLFIDSIKDKDTIEFIHSKVNQVRRNTQMPISPQLAPSIRPMSPLLSTGLEQGHHSNSSANPPQHNSGLDSLIGTPDATAYIQPTPSSNVLSPLMGSSYSQLTRPRSAGPGQYPMMASLEQDAASQFGFVTMPQPQHPTGNGSSSTNVMSELLSQPLLRVLSDGGGGPDVDQRGRSSGFSKVLRSNYQNNSSSLPPPMNRGRQPMSPVQPAAQIVPQASNKDIVSEELLTNIPQWLKALRLHKYTDNLKDLNWRDMVLMNDDDLLKLGVSTVGARNKLLKSFSLVKEHYSMA